MKPRLFIGSSVESIQIAKVAQLHLQHCSQPKVWDQGIFELSRNGLESLVSALDDFEFALFVFAPDDFTTLRGKEFRSVRDNVVFEFGLFIGRLGRENTFFLIPKGETDLRIPTDLLGINPCKYDPNWLQSDIQAALGPPCTEIELAINKREVQIKKPKEITPNQPTDLDENDILSALQEYLESFSHSPGTRFRYDETDRKLSLPEGSAKKYLAIVAEKLGLEVDLPGANTVMIRDSSFT